MKKIIQTLVIATFATAGASQFVGCGEGSGSVEDPPNNDEGPPAEEGGGEEGGGEEGGGEEGGE
jgi:hypothetical protein